MIFQRSEAASLTENTQELNLGVFGDVWGHAAGDFGAIALLGLGLGGISHIGEPDDIPIAGFLIPLHTNFALV